MTTKLTSLEEVLVWLVITTVVSLLVLNVVGHLTQREALVIQVLDKEISRTTETRCAEESENGCERLETTTIIHYLVTSPGEKFSTTAQLYARLKVGRRHHVVVTGWKGGWGRVIAEVLE